MDAWFLEVCMDNSDEDADYLWVQTDNQIVKNYKQVQHINSYGAHGKKPGQFLDPLGISSTDGFICVTDPMKSSLTVFPETMFENIPSGTVLSTEIGPEKECYFSSVFDVAIHQTSKNVLVSDPLNKCIHCVAIDDEKGNESAIFDKDISLPDSDTLSGICVTDDGLIGVLDSELGRVMICDGRGEIRTSFGGEGHEKGKFCLPQFICWDELNQRFIVSDTANARVQLFTVDGRFLFSFGEFGFKAGECFKYPSGVTTDDHGRIFVADQGLHNIQIFDKDGHWLHTLGGPGMMPGFFNSPKSLSLLNNGDLIVTDNLNCRLQHFG